MGGVSMVAGGARRDADCGGTGSAAMSEMGVVTILARLDLMEREHAADMAALGARLDVLTQAHRSCVARCHVGNEQQIRAAIEREAGK